MSDQYSRYPMSLGDAMAALLRVRPRWWTAQQGQAGKNILEKIAAGDPIDAQPGAGREEMATPGNKTPQA